jgi:hypothetical protein
MNQFGKETRQWLLSVIRQRKLLLIRNRSHKSELEVEIAIKILEDLLSAYSYENPMYMARFIGQHTGDIDVLLPGKGSTCYMKKQKEFAEIRKSAMLIIAGNQAESIRRQAEIQKTLQFSI